MNTEDALKPSSRDFDQALMTGKSLLNEEDRSSMPFMAPKDGTDEN